MPTSGGPGQQVTPNAIRAMPVTQLWTPLGQQ